MAEAAPLNVPGATLRQERLAVALLDPNIKTKTEAMLKAGYAPSTALTQQGRASGHVGTQTAVERHLARRADKARGLDAIIERTVGKPELVDELDPRDKLQLGLAAMKLRADLGVEPERGNGLAFVEWKKRRLRRSSSMLIRMHASGIGPLGWRAPQHVVLSPAITELSTEK